MARSTLALLIQIVLFFGNVNTMPLDARAPQLGGGQGDGVPPMPSGPPGGGFPGGGPGGPPGGLPPLPSGPPSGGLPGGGSGGGWPTNFPGLPMPTWPPGGGPGGPIGGGPSQSGSMTMSMSMSMSESVGSSATVAPTDVVRAVGIFGY